MQRFIQRFCTTNFHYNAARNIFSAEASECGYPGGLTELELVNPKTQNSRVFTFVSADSDGEDTHGWNFKSADGIKLLIIND